MQKKTALATGGASSLYARSTNPELNTGLGIAMAFVAGCTVANLEFQQFHPTALNKAGAPCFLLSEALRGEGAILLNDKHERFMTLIHSRAELAPRDIVARAIYRELSNSPASSVPLTLSHRPSKFITQRFPEICAQLKRYGVDLAHDLIPVAPAAHYTCGGIWVDKMGQTSLPGLYAIGECSYTGLHGANRLASNSLLECIVYAVSLAEHCRLSLPTEPLLVGNHQGLPIVRGNLCHPPETIQKFSELMSQLKKVMWQHVGIVRINKQLNQAKQLLATLKREFVAVSSGI